MFGLDPIIVALIFIGLGILLAFLVQVILRSSNLPPQNNSDPHHLGQDEAGGNINGVLIIGPGGKVHSANKVLRDWLNLSPDAQPNLEHIARRTNPPDEFLNLCATPQKSRLSMQGMLLDAESFAVPSAEDRLMLVVFKRVDITPVRSDSSSDSSALNIIGELGVLMTTNSDLPQTIRAILESVERLIPADIAEITIWEPDDYEFVPYRLIGPAGEERRLDMPATRYKPGVGYTGKLFKSLEPIVVNRHEMNGFENANDDDKSYPFKSYLGVPLIMGDAPIGTLELGSLSNIDYTEHDLQTLKLLSNQAAVALHHALSRKEEEQRAVELTGLANLVQSVWAIKEPRDLFSHLINSIQPLLDVEVLGFLIFDENTRLLQAQAPFLGVPDHIVRLYKVEIKSDSRSEFIWLSQETIHAPAAETDEQLADLGLLPMLQASGVRSTVLVPLIVGNNSIGYLQAANKRSGMPFGTEDMRILSIVASQSAIILENADLLSKSRQRTMQAEALRRISALAGSAATLDEILYFTVTETVRLIHADKAAIFLLNKDQSELEIHTNSVYGLTEDQTTSIRKFRVDDPIFSRSNTVKQRVSVFNRHSPELENEDFYLPIFEAMEIESGLSVPLTVSDRTVGEMLFGSKESDFFHQGEVMLATSAAGQLAGAIERVMSSTRTDVNLRRRVDLLTALNRVFRELNTSRTLSDLLDVIHREALNLMGADCGTVYSLIRKGNSFTITASSGDHADNKRRLGGIELAGLNEESPLVVKDFEKYSGQSPHGGVDAALLIPLFFEDEVYGLVSLHSYDPNAFDEETIETASAFSHQAAIALWNLTNFRDPRQDGAGRPITENLLPLSRELSGSDRAQAALEIVRVIARQTSREAIFSTLGSELINKLGFDLSLVAIPSANGAILTDVIGQLPPETNPDVLLGQRNPLRDTLRSGKTLLLSNLKTKGNADWQNSPLLSQLNTRSFACFPIRSSDPDSMIEAAVLSVSNRVLPEFTPEDFAAFDLISKQVATSLNNVTLVSQTKERMREVDLLLNFSRQLSSLNEDEILRSMVANAQNLIPAVQGVQILLWDEQNSRLAPFSVSGYRNDGVMASLNWLPGEGLPGEVFLSSTTRRVGEVNIASDYNLPYEKLMQYQEAVQGIVPIASLVAPIVASTSTLGVVVLDNFSSVEAFSEEDEALVNSLVRQSGLILENARLFEEANTRARQLQSLSDVATTITSDLQVEPITASLLDHLKQILPFDTGTFWFRQGNLLAIRATQGFDGDEDRVGLTVQIQDSKLLSDMVAEGRPINVKNVTEDERFLIPTEFARLSWLGIPLIAKGQVVGVIALEKAEPAFYTQEHIQIATAFAGQAAVALENARLFEESIQRAYELNERSQRLDLLNRLSNEFSTYLDTDHILAYTVDEIRKAVSCTAVSAILLDEKDFGHLVAQSPISIEPLPQPFDFSPFDRLHESLGVRVIDNAYTDPEMQPLEHYWKQMGTQSALVLSIATGNELHGILILHSHSRLSSSEVDLARTISNQVAVAIQNAKLFKQLRKLTAELEQRVNTRTEELEREHTRTETLLGIITELSASLDMDIVLNRTLALINRITGAQHSTIILANPADASLLRRASQGYTSPVPEGGESTGLEINQGLAGWVIENREPALIEDLQNDPRWVSRGETAHRSAIAIPLMLGAEALGTLMLFHKEVGVFSKDHLDMVNAAAKQIAVAVNNAHLYLLIRDQAERLGGMLRSQQVEASRLRAILEAVADGILVTDARGQISIFNHSAEEILNLSPENVIHQSLDYFTGLFGKAGEKWMETIRTWSAEPHDFDESELFIEQIRLENNHIVAVNLAPVYSAREFMGTVSIFRDITHLVEVDRMKSEFVATVSHELRTPMTSIKGYVDILLMGAAGELSSQQQTFLDIVKSNTERLNVLVNDLLEVSRIEAGKINLNMAPVDLPALVGEVATEFRMLSREENKGMQIKVDPPDRLPQVRGDIDRIRQIITNLMGNAYNYTQPGGKISVSFQVAKDLVRIAVKDTGVGIPPEEQDRVFERFFRGEAPLVSSVAGTGLGLSIVKYLVSLHGGEIWVDSTGLPGEGSTFYFTLPIY